MNGEEGSEGFIEKRLSEVKYETTYVGFDCGDVTGDEDVRR